MDQAAKLRELITDKGSINSHMEPIQQAGARNARVICVTSGKGGVGKTNFTANLAIALSKQGKKIVIIDADLGLANIDVLLGVIPTYSLLDVVNSNKDITEVMCKGPNGLQIISGGSGILDLVDMLDKDLDTLLNEFNKLYDLADIILIDTGAGLTKSVLSFACASDEVIIITTPEPTSLTDAYAMIKTLWLRQKDKKINIVINRVENVKEGKIAFEKLEKVCSKFLDIKIHRLGFMTNDINVGRAVKRQKPFIIEYPNIGVSKSIGLMALKLTNDSIGEEKDPIKSSGFISKFIKMFRQERD